MLRLWFWLRFWLFHCQLLDTDTYLELSCDVVFIAYLHFKFKVVVDELLGDQVRIYCQLEFAVELYEA